MYQQDLLALLAIQQPNSEEVVWPSSPTPSTSTSAAAAAAAAAVAAAATHHHQVHPPQHQHHHHQQQQQGQGGHELDMMLNKQMYDPRSPTFLYNNGGSSSSSSSTISSATHPTSWARTQAQVASSTASSTSPAPSAAATTAATTTTSTADPVVMSYEDFLNGYLNTYQDGYPVIESRRHSVPNVLMQQHPQHPSPLHQQHAPTPASTGSLHPQQHEVSYHPRQHRQSLPTTLHTTVRVPPTTTTTNKKRMISETNDDDFLDDDRLAYPAPPRLDTDDPSAVPRRQRGRYDGDEYTPRWARYQGQLKEGYCNHCRPGKWLQLKNSAYWYHKQFFHGISSVSGQRFLEPLEQRAGEGGVVEGLCHQCRQFVPICNAKRKTSVLWYRHAHKCHIYDKPRPQQQQHHHNQQQQPQQQQRPIKRMKKYAS